MKVYNVYHLYDVDGGFGDAIATKDLLATFENEDDAKAFVDKYNNPRTYDIPYDSLECGRLVMRETEVITHVEFDINKPVEEYGMLYGEPYDYEDDYEEVM